MIIDLLTSDDHSNDDANIQKMFSPNISSPFLVIFTFDEKLQNIYVYVIYNVCRQLMRSHI